MFNTYKCDYCKETTDQHNEVILNGIKDFYSLEICNKCCELLNDYFPPEEL